MTVYKGKWFFAVRFRNDLCVGLGRAPEWMREEMLAHRPHRGIEPS